MKEEDEWKIDFQTKYELYKCLVMSFGLTMHLHFHMINKSSRTSIRKFIVVYFDDILMY